MTESNWSIEQELRNADLARQVRDLNNELELRYRETQLRDDQARVANERKAINRSSYVSQRTRDFYSEMGTAPTEKVHLTKEDMVVTFVYMGLLIVFGLGLIILPLMHQKH